MPHSNRPGEELGGRYRLVDLLAESTGGRFWRAHDRVLSRHVAVHVIAVDDPRAELLLEAARSSAAVVDRRVLRVLDADRGEGQVWVVNEWGNGTSLDELLAEGPLGPRRAAWIAAEAAEAVAVAHRAGIAHGRLVPENVLVDQAGHVRLIGLAVDAALHGLPAGRLDEDVVDLGGLLYAGMTGRWAGTTASRVPPAPTEAGRVLRPRRVRAGVPRTLDHLCDELLNDALPAGGTRNGTPASAADLAGFLSGFVGDPVGMATSLATVAGPSARPLDPGEDSRAVRAPGTLPPGAEAAPAADPATDPATDPVTGPPTEALPQAPPPGVGGATVAEQVPDRPEEPAWADVVEPTRVVPLAPELDADLPAGPDTGPDTGPDERTVVAEAVPTRPTGPADDGDVGGSRAGSTAYAGSGGPEDGAGTAAPAELPTQAGVPIFHDGTDEVDWLRARSEKPPPPPPFEEPPERPLFAPDPAPGEPLRRPRPGVAAAEQTGQGYWPWGDTGTGTGASVATGTGAVFAEPDPEPEGVPGRHWLRLALLLALAVLVVLAAAFAFDLGRDEEPDDPAAEPSADASPSAQPTPLTGLVATDLDPQGQPPEENPDLAPLAVDGDPATAWRTSSYLQQLGPAGLKTGVGLVVDLGEQTAPRDVAVTVLGGTTSATFFLAEEEPTAVADLDPVAEATGDGTLRADLEGAEGRFLVVWLTELPAVDDGFRGEVAEVVVRR